MFVKAIVLCSLVASASAFAPSRVALRSSSHLSVSTSKSPKSNSIFEKAVKDWESQYPAIYNVGWGPTTLAERWNGRHAMFGWIALIVTGYCKGHGLIPNPDTALDLKEWGTLAYLYGGSISNERAIIIVGHLHLLLFSVCAAVAPLSFQDKLYLEKGEEHTPAAGLIPKIVPGLTPEAEVLNGRLAMLGLTVLVAQSTITQTPILDTINAALGGLLF